MLIESVIDGGGALPAAAHERRWQRAMETGRGGEIVLVFGSFCRRPRDETLRE